MGADMILAACELPSDMKACMPLILDRLEKLTRNEILTIGCYFEDRLEDLKDEIEDNLSEDDLWKLDDLVFLKTKNIVKKELKDSLHILEAYPRDTVTMTLSGVSWIFCGDQSWGDSPDSYDPISMLYNSGILDGMGHEDFDPKADSERKSK